MLPYLHSLLKHKDREEPREVGAFSLLKTYLSPENLRRRHRMSPDIPFVTCDMGQHRVHPTWPISSSLSWQASEFFSKDYSPTLSERCRKKNAYECSCWGFRTADNVIWASEKMWKWDSCTFRCTFRCTCQSTLLRYVAIISFLFCNAVETSARAWSGSSRCIAWQIASSLVSSQILAICMLNCT